MFAGPLVHPVVDVGVVSRGSGIVEVSGPAVERKPPLQLELFAVAAVRRLV